MAQNYDNTAAIGDTGGSLLQEMLDRTDALLSAHSGTSAPSYKVLGTIWLDTSATPNALKIWDGSAWVTLFDDITTSSGGLVSASAGAFDTASPTSAVAASGSTNLVRKGEVDAMTQVALVKVTGSATTFTRPLGVFPACTVSEVSILSDTATSSDGSNNWAFQVTNKGTDGTGTNTLLSTAKNTNGADIAAYDSYALGVDQNTSVSANEGLQITATETGTATDLSSAELVVSITYTVAV